MKRTEIAFTSIDPGYELVQRAFYPVTHGISNAEHSTKRELLIRFTSREIKREIENVPDFIKNVQNPHIRISINLDTSKRKKQISVGIYTEGGKRISDNEKISLDRLEELLKYHYMNRPIPNCRLRACIVTTNSNTTYRYSRFGFPNIYIDYVTLSRISDDDIKKFRTTQRIESLNMADTYPSIDRLLSDTCRYKYGDDIMIGEEPIIFVGTKFSGHSHYDIVDRIVEPELVAYARNRRLSIADNIHISDEEEDETYIYDASKRMGEYVYCRSMRRRDVIDVAMFTKPFSWEVLPNNDDYVDTDTVDEKYYSKASTPNGNDLIKGWLNDKYGVKPDTDSIKMPNTVLIDKTSETVRREEREEAERINKAMYDYINECHSTKSLEEHLVYKYGAEKAKDIMLISEKIRKTQKKNPLRNLHIMGEDKKIEDIQNPPEELADEKYAEFCAKGYSPETAKFYAKIANAFGKDIKIPENPIKSENSDPVKLSDFIEIMEEALVFKPKEGESESDKTARFMELLSSRWEAYRRIAIADGITPDVLLKIYALQDQVVAQFKNTGECPRSLCNELGMLMLDTLFPKWIEGYKHYKYDFPISEPTEEVKAPPICAFTPHELHPFKPLTEEDKARTKENMETQHPSWNGKSPDYKALMKYIQFISRYIIRLKAIQLTPRDDITYSLHMNGYKSIVRILKNYRTGNTALDEANGKFTHHIRTCAKTGCVSADGLIEYRNDLALIIDAAEGRLEAEDVVSNESGEKLEVNTDPASILNRLSDNQLVQVTCESIVYKFINTLDKYLYRVYMHNKANTSSFPYVLIDSREGLIDAEIALKNVLGVIISTPNNATIICEDKMVSPAIKNLNEYNTKLVDFIRENLSNGEIPASGLREYYNSLKTIFDTPTADKIMHSLTSMLLHSPAIRKVEKYSDEVNDSNDPEDGIIHSNSEENTAKVDIASKELEEFKKRLITHCKPNLFRDYLILISGPVRTEIGFTQTYLELKEAMGKLLSKRYSPNDEFDEAIANLENAISLHRISCDDSTSN